MNIAAVDIGGTKIKYCLYEDNNIKNITFHSVDTPDFSNGAELINYICDTLEPLGDFKGVAISTCGIVDINSGCVVSSSNIKGYSGTKIKEIVNKRFGLPVLVENDARSAALCEIYFGAGKQHKDFICITIGTGVGGAIVTEGELYRGSKFAAAEFGHFVLHPSGKLCNCGQRGCYERYASASSLVRLTESETVRKLGGRWIMKEYRKNGEIKRITDSWMNEILRGLAILLHIFNPGCIVMGGGIMDDALILEYLKNNIDDHLMPFYRGIELQRAFGGNNAGMLGVAKRLAVTLVTAKQGEIIWTERT